MRGVPRDLISRFWNHVENLRDDGFRYGDCLEQISYLILLKVEDERETLLGEVSRIPRNWRWSTLLEYSGSRLREHFEGLVAGLSGEPGIVGRV